MSDTVSYRGIIAPTAQQKIRLHTIKGKVGYRISKFQTVSATPGATGAVEAVLKIYNKDNSGSVSATVDFTESDLLAVVYYQDHDASSYPDSSTIIFDNEVFNQDIFVTCADAAGGSISMNFYIELERMDLNDIQATQATLKSIRNIVSK
jgi:hypothetical protein